MMYLTPGVTRPLIDARRKLRTRNARPDAIEIHAPAWIFISDKTIIPPIHRIFHRP
jgi:hypothetical protein